MKRLRLTLIALAVMTVSGCGLGDLIAVSCVFQGDDADHCYQAAAVQNSDPEGCEKVTGKDFGSSNPPRDKCYLQIAENTDNYETCGKIEGGFMSYSQEECVTGIAIKNFDPEGCKRLEGSEADRCKEAIAEAITSDKLKEINEEVERAKSEAGSDPNDADAKEKLKKLLAKQAAMFENAPEAAKGEFMKSSRESILEDVDDADVKSEIVRLTLAARDAAPGMSLNDQLAKLAEIKEQQETIKRLDEQANTLMDQVKEGASGFASQTFDDLYGDDVEAYKKAMEAKARAFLEEQGGQRMKEGIAQLESMKEKYDKASEQYEALSEKAEKLKKVYDELQEVYSKVDAINKLVAEGKIDAARAKVLHGAVYLSKGLEYATGYVPIFGSTVSTITKETMNATIKFATSRASRTTAIDKCIEDPENCDPNGISPY
jgi:hypothetical protein